MAIKFRGGGGGLGGSEPLCCTSLVESGPSYILQEVAVTVQEISLPGESLPFFVKGSTVMPLNVRSEVRVVLSSGSSPLLAVVP